VITALKEVNKFNEIARPDPDALLKEIQRGEIKKGRLKTFLGYAPGVGKTSICLSS